MTNNLFSQLLTFLLMMIGVLKQVLVARVLHSGSSEGSSSTVTMGLGGPLGTGMGTPITTPGDGMMESGLTTLSPMLGFPPPSSVVLSNPACFLRMISSMISDSRNEMLSPVSRVPPSIDISLGFGVVVDDDS